MCYVEVDLFCTLCSEHFGEFDKGAATVANVVNDEDFSSCDVSANGCFCDLPGLGIANFAAEENFRSLRESLGKFKSFLFRSSIRSDQC